MGIEIERKFLVADRSCVVGAEGVRMAQGYLSLDPDRTVRVRLAGDKAWLTIKGRSEGMRRAEFEYPIAADDARALLGMCLPSVVEKTRHRIAVGEHVWEVDVFHGDNDGLVLAEVELSDESDVLRMPPWIGVEVTDDPRFLNANLATVPFRSFGHAD